MVIERRLYIDGKQPYISCAKSNEYIVVLAGKPDFGHTHSGHLATADSKNHHMMKIAHVDRNSIQPLSVALTIRDKTKINV